MSKSFVLHDESVNTYGFRMLTAGGDLSEFIKNPVMLLNHDDWSLPIGRWENIRKENGQILADPVYDLKDDRGSKVAGKVDDGFLNAASIGAWPPEEVSDDPVLKLSGQIYPTVTKWTAREASIVTIGSNHNALVFYDAKGLKIDMHDALNVIKLMDNHKFSLKTNHMDLNKILNLADTADDAARLQAVNLLLADKSRLEGDNVRLKGENTTLTGRIDEINAADVQAKKQEAIALVDLAVKDGRVNADGKASFIELFDLDFAKAQTILGSLPKRQSLSGRIDNEEDTNNVELSDLAKKDWNTLDKEGKLTLLFDKYPELYKEKFAARFPKPKK